ncbi:MAG: MarR family transcriptional regulator, partial [Gammaproteobacteria bacterium]|nr:MarR family transcriptional regulator [Gammaproteobacteria bacterium]
MSLSKVKPKPVVARPKAHLRFWLKLLKVSRLIESEVRERLRIEFAT